MVQEATSIVIAEDLARSASPEDRRAPDECWDQLYRIMKEGKPAASLDSPDRKLIYAIPFIVSVHSVLADDQFDSEIEPPQVHTPDYPLVVPERRRSSTPPPSPPAC